MTNETQITVSAPSGSDEPIIGSGREPDLVVGGLPSLRRSRKGRYGSILVFGATDSRAVAAVPKEATKNPLESVCLAEGRDDVHPADAALVGLSPEARRWRESGIGSGQCGCGSRRMGRR